MSPLTPWRRPWFVGARDLMTVNGAAQHLGTVLADPAAGDEALQGMGVRHHDYSEL